MNTGNKPLVIFKQLALKSRFAAVSPLPSALPVTPAVKATPERRERLFDTDHRELNERLRPLAKYFTREPWPPEWSIYWLPAKLQGPVPNTREIRFLSLLLDKIQKADSSQRYTFFQQFLVYPHLIEWFTLNSLALEPVPAIGIRPENGPARFPAQADVDAIHKEDAAAISEQKGQDMRLEDFFPYLPPPVYWIRGDQDMALSRMFGYGGWSVSLSSLDEKAFFPAAKLLLAESAGEGVQAFPIVTPILTPKYFIGGALPVMERWFEIFDLFVAECAQDKGVLIASKICLDDVLSDLVLESGLRDQSPEQPKTYTN